MVPRRSAPRRGRPGVPVGMEPKWLFRSPVVPLHLAPRWAPRGVPVEVLPHLAQGRVRPGQVVKRSVVRWMEVAQSVLGQLEVEQVEQVVVIQL